MVHGLEDRIEAYLELFKSIEARAGDRELALIVFRSLLSEKGAGKMVRVLKRQRGIDRYQSGLDVLSQFSFLLSLDQQRLDWLSSRVSSAKSVYQVPGSRGYSYAAS